MTPPINIDGSQVTEVTIDGQAVSQVTVDGQNVLSAIPDSVNSRPSDDNSVSGSFSIGLTIRPNSDFGDIAYRISANTSNATRARLYDYDGSNGYVESIDISSLSAGDTFSIQFSYISGNDYGVELDNNGNSWTAGYFSGTNSDDYPVSGQDIDIVSASQDGSQSSSQSYIAINDIGNPDGFLG